MRASRWVAASFPLGLVLAVAGTGPARAQAWARFDVPGGDRVVALRAAGAAWEPAWNALLVAQLRAERAGADSAVSLLRLANALARSEAGAIGSRIAPDALALRSRWGPEQRRARIEAAVAESLATAAQGAGDWGSADSLFGRSLALYRSVGERRREAWVLGSLGQNAFTARRIAVADSLYRQALVARRGIGDARMVGNTLNSLGSTAYEQRRYAEAWSWYQQARTAREGTGERGALANTLNFLGNAARALGRPDTARVLYGSALELASAAGDSAVVSSVLINYGGLLADAGEPGRARGMCERALAIVRARGDRRRAGVLAVLIGDLLRQQGRFAESVATLEQAAAAAEASHDPVAVRDALTSLGRAWLGLKDPERARPPLERAQSLADSLGDDLGRARVLSNRALVARLESDRGGAERLAGEALSAGRRAGDSTAVHGAAVTLGEIALERDDGEGAARWFETAASAGASLDVENRASDLGNLGIAAERQGRLDEAEARYREAMALATRTGATELVWPSLLGLGDVAERRGDMPAALAHDRHAATLIDTLRSRQGAEASSITLFARRLFAYEALIHLLGKLDAGAPDSGFAAEAFRWSERSRARAFLDLLAAGGRTPPERAAHPYSLAEAQAALPSDADALLEYSVGDSSSSLWVITRRAWRRFTLPARPALRLRVEALRRALASPERADSRAAHAASRALHAALVEPALPLLRGVRHLVISPDGPLALLPFEALLGRDDGSDAPAPAAAYLVRRFDVSYVPSASTLAALAAPGAGRGIVALGDPCFACRDSAAGGSAAPALDPLPNTAAEVEALRRLAGGRPFRALTGREATRSALLALPGLAGADLVHLATHGVADEAEPARSGLWLAPEPGGNGSRFLSVPDILALRLDASLVTLSACETGLGRLERGEGVLGLSRAFLSAGARSVVVSLWSVNDRSSAILMEAFYASLLGEGRSRARALAGAKRSLLGAEATRSPFHWAPFVLVGEPGALSGAR